MEKHFSAVSLWHQPTDMKLKQKVSSLVDLFFVIVVDICVIKWYKKSHKAIFKVSSVFTWCKPHFIINKFEKMEWKLYDCKKLTWIQISKNLHFCYGFFSHLPTICHWLINHLFCRWAVMLVKTKSQVCKYFCFHIMG